MQILRTALTLLALLCAAPLAARPPSRPGIDAPQLAHLGPHAVGFRTVTYVQPNRPDFKSIADSAATVPLRNRTLTVDLWYPAAASKASKPVLYRSSLFGEPPKPPVSFAHTGLALQFTKTRGTKHPLVILSHGYSNAPAVMTWLTENLASKGYVVAAIHHRDPNPYTISAAERAAPNYDRPHDIAYVAARLRKDLGAQIDPDRIALIGYSQGGYGVLTAGGATLDADHPNLSAIAGGFGRKLSDSSAQISVPGVKAIIALAPAGGGERLIWGATGLKAIKAPLFLIAGDADPVTGYERGAKAMFAAASKSERWLLTYRQAGHSIALNPVPPEMRNSLWDMDWFEDPIWRQDRINAINQHFITAFLGLHLKGDAAYRAYLDVPVENSDEGDWAAPAGTRWGAYSPGGPGVTLWKGFQRRHARGMTLERAAAD